MIYNIYKHKFCLLFLDEMRRERDFYKSRNMACPKDLPQNHDDDNEKVMEAHAESDFHRLDEQVNVCLECMSNNFKSLQRRFIRCSSQATITHLKKLVAKKILNGIDKYREVILYSLSLLLSFKCLIIYFYAYRLIYCVMKNYWARIIR